VTGELGRLGAVTWLSLRGSLRGARLVGLTGFALVPTLIVAAVAGTHPSPDRLADAAASLFTLLTLPIIAMVIVLVLAVAQFRNEIDAETLLYLSDRSVTRPTIVLGKYFGSTAAGLVLVLPATLAPLGIAALGGGTPYSLDVPFVLAAAAVLAVVAYGGFFLFLGLASRSALLIGLLFGFLWEELVPLLPGEIPRLTVIFYLRSFLSWELTSGPLSGFSTSVSLPVSVVAPIAVAVAFLVLGSAAFLYLETAPERESV
jgi:ABC-2 type transport system permease protein